MPYVKKLGSDRSYRRPKKTFQEQLSNTKIAEMLQGYERVENIADVPINTHLRYFSTLPNGTQLFRTGGFLHNKSNPDKYVILRNATSSWSVQIKGTVFFRKLSHKEELEVIHDLYKKKLASKNKEIIKLQTDMVEKMDQINHLRKLLSRYSQSSNRSHQSQHLPTDQEQVKRTSSTLRSVKTDRVDYLDTKKRGR